ARGKPAEQVAAEAAQEMKTFLATQAAVDRHLADQIILYAALAEGLSSLTTECLTSHLLTNIWVVEQFLPVKFEISGQMGEQGAIRVRGVAGSEQ
ncbi:MAG: RNA 3'-phosphate cyclase, partial [Deltaproteobacteria bacterium]|nr:RNA 3'-phosphate cyclase [Deltaproteobacteria bacterium]